VRPQSNSLNPAAAGEILQLSWLQQVVGGEGACWKARARGERPEGWRLRAPAAPNLFPARHSTEQEKLGPGWNHVLQGGSVVKSEATKGHAPNPSGAGGQTRERAAPAGGRPKPDIPAAPIVGPQQPQPKHTDSSLPQPQRQSPLEVIIDLLDNLPTSACLQLTRPLLSTASYVPAGDAHLRAVLKTVILFLAELGGKA
jgi:hypothetical protein